MTLPTPKVRTRRTAGISYKFQRLRERIRQAVASGELAGKLPGERLLAKRFHVNAKTLSKALTDLAAEGVLDRSIGRGTYVKGSAPQQQTTGRWLVVCDATDPCDQVVASLREINPDLQVIHEVAGLRPSFLNQFAAVVVLGNAAPETFLREITVRNMPLVAINREPGKLSVHTAIVDVQLAASRIAREMILAGHTRFAAIESPGSTVLADAMRMMTRRYAPDATIDVDDSVDVSTLINNGITAVVCHSARCAAEVQARLISAGISVPSRVSLAAVGCAESPAPCSGYYVAPRQMAEAAAELLRDASARPATLWLNGDRHDCGTIAAKPFVHSHEMQPVSMPSGIAV